MITDCLLTSWTTFVTSCHNRTGLLYFGGHGRTREESIMLKDRKFPNDPVKNITDDAIQRTLIEQAYF